MAATLARRHDHDRAGRVVRLVGPHRSRTAPATELIATVVVTTLRLDALVVVTALRLEGDVVGLHLWCLDATSGRVPGGLCLRGEQQGAGHGRACQKSCRQLPHTVSIFHFPLLIVVDKSPASLRVILILWRLSVQGH
jgi:hypothetical protein